MSTYSFHKEATQRIAAVLISTLIVYGGLFHRFVLAADSEVENSPELRQTILGLNLEGLTLTSTPEQAHATLISAGYKAHRGNKPGNGIYWKQQTKKLTRRILLKSIQGKLTKLQFSFMEKNGDATWQQVLGEIKEKLGSTLQLCQQSTEHNLECKLTSESPDMLSAHITTSHGNGINKIRVNLDHYLPGNAQDQNPAKAKSPTI